MAWYGWVILIQFIVNVVVTAIMIYYMRKITASDTSRIATDTIVNLVEQQTKQTETRILDQLKVGLRLATVDFESKQRQLEALYNSKLKDIDNDQKELYSKLSSDDAALSAWLDTKLGLGTDHSKTSTDPTNK
jgi:hypothetical protein